MAAVAFKRARRDAPVAATAAPHSVWRSQDMIASILAFVSLNERVAVLATVARAWNEAVATNPAAWSRNDVVLGASWSVLRNPLPRALRAANAARAFFTSRAVVAAHPDLRPHRAAWMSGMPMQPVFSQQLEELHVYLNAMCWPGTPAALTKCTSLHTLRVTAGSRIIDTFGLVAGAARGGTLRRLEMTWRLDDEVALAQILDDPELAQRLEVLRLRMVYRPAIGARADAPIPVQLDALRELAIELPSGIRLPRIRFEARVRALTVIQSVVSLRAIASFVHVADVETLTLDLSGFSWDGHDGVPCFPAATTVVLEVEAFPPRGDSGTVVADVCARAFPCLRRLRLSSFMGTDVVGLRWLADFAGTFRSTTVERIDVGIWPKSDLPAALLRSADARARLPSLRHVGDD